MVATTALNTGGSLLRAKSPEVGKISHVINGSLMSALEMGGLGVEQARVYVLCKRR